jgi:hypothetical protein
MANRVTIQKALTNRLKRDLDKTNKLYDERVKVTKGLIEVLFRLSIVDRWHNSWWSVSIPNRIEEEREKLIERMLCIKKQKYYRGSKNHTWRESNEQVRKAEDKRNRKLESRLREEFYRNSLQTKSNANT